MVLSLLLILLSVSSNLLIIVLSKYLYHNYFTCVLVPPTPDNSTSVSTENLLSTSFLLFFPDLVNRLLNQITPHTTKKITKIAANIPKQYPVTRPVPVSGFKKLYT